MSYLTNKKILFIEVSSKHFRSFARYRFNFNTYFQTLTCSFYGFVIWFDWCHDTQFNKLKKNKNKKDLDNNFSRMVTGVVREAYFKATAKAQGSHQLNQDSDACVQKIHWWNEGRKSMKELWNPIILIWCWKYRWNDNQFENFPKTWYFANYVVKGKNIV